jgi:hypothetical protein
VNPDRAVTGQRSSANPHLPLDPFPDSGFSNARRAPSMAKDKILLDNVIRAPGHNCSAARLRTSRSLSVIFTLAALVRLWGLGTNSIVPREAFQRKVTNRILWPQGHQ